MKSLREFTLICVFFSFVFVKETLSCNGFSLKLNSLKNCGKDDIIRIGDKFTVDLDKNCNVIPKGCGTVTKPFNTLSIKYTFTKPPMGPLEGTLDACHLLENENSISAIMSAFALPTKCPVRAQKICVNGDKTFNISKYRMQLGLLAGNIKIKLEGKHDTGKTCLQIDLSLLKK